MSAVQCLSRIALICRDVQTLATFYEAAFDCVRADETAIAESALSELLGLPNASARGLTLRLGEQAVELIELHPAGRSYPQGISARSPLFQHFAIVVAGMDLAFARLSALAGWTAISIGGPQALPASSGGVTAYKFRDPEGHPLELIEFPSSSAPKHWQRKTAELFLGIDHSAISVASTARSSGFYERLGLKRKSGSLNGGPAQDRLDGIAGAHVAVTALAFPGDTPPHLEFLCYDETGQETPLPGINDVAATRLVLTVESAETLNALCLRSAAACLSAPVRFADGSLRALLRDPDGHLLCLQVSPE